MPRGAPVKAERPVHQPPKPGKKARYSPSSSRQNSPRVLPAPEIVYRHCALAVRMMVTSVKRMPEPGQVLQLEPGSTDAALVVIGAPQLPDKGHAVPPSSPQRRQ